MIEFQNPLALIGLVAVPLAILLLIWRRRAIEIAVPSLIHWKGIPEDDAEGARRLRLQGIRSIVLAAAAISTIVAAIAGPVITLSEGEGRARVIIDRSASMQTIHEGRRRLDLAKEEATRLVRSWGPGVRVDLLALPGRGWRAYGATPEEAVADLGAVTPSILPLALEAVLPDILTAPGEVEPVFLFTDRIPSLVDGARAAVSSVGGPSDNVGITEFEVGADRVFVSVGNFTDGPREVPLRLRGLDPRGGAFERESALSLAAGEEGIWSVPIPPLVEVEVTQLIPDSFPLDDRVTAVLTPPGPLRCTVVGGRCASVERALGAIRGVEVADLSDGAAGPELLTVYYRQIPTAAPEGPVVLIDPPEGWGGIDLGPVIEAPEGIIASGGPWEDLSLSGVRLGPARSIRGGHTPVLRSLPGGETVAGLIEGEGWRAIVVAFDTEGRDANWRERVSYPLFWAKVAEWAGLPSEGARILRGGERLTFRVDFPPANLTGPDGEVLARFDATGPRDWLPERPGTYTLEDRAGRRPYSVNLLSVTESRVSGAPCKIPLEARTIPMHDPRVLEGWPLLVCLFLVLAALEWGARRERIDR